MPIVSIIIPAYNSGNYLAETLNSVLSQTYSDWECIIMDDGSTDNTFSIAQEYSKKDNRFHYFIQTNQGPAVARNNAIKQSIGEYILPLDADDLIADTYIEKATNYFTIHPETTLVYCKANFFGCENGEWELPEFKYDSFIWQNCICSCAMYRRKDYDNTPGYNPNMIYGDEDWDFWLSLLSETSVVHCIDEILFHYRIRESSRTISSLSPNIEKTKRQIYWNHPNIYQSYLNDIVLLHEQNNGLKRQLYEEKLRFDAIRRSRAYRLGKILLKPFSLMQKDSLLHG